MPKPRYAQVSLEATPWYHYFSRCVRRDFLCGLDTITGVSYEHRKQWVEEKNHEAAVSYSHINKYSFLLCVFHKILLWKTESYDNE